MRDASAPEALWKRAGARVRVPRALEFLNWTPRSRSCTSTYQVLRGAGHGLAHGTHSREGGRRRADPARPSRRERSWMIRAAERTNPAVLTHLSLSSKHLFLLTAAYTQLSRADALLKQSRNMLTVARGAEISVGR